MTSHPDPVVAVTVKEYVVGVNTAVAGEPEITAVGPIILRSTPLGRPESIAPTALPIRSNSILVIAVLSHTV